MIFFSFIFSFLSIIAYVSVFSKKTSRQFFALIIFVIVTFGVIISTLRIGTTGDYQNYELYFNAVQNGNPASTGLTFEVGYYWLNKIIGLLSENFHAFLMIESILIFGLYFLFIKNIDTSRKTILIFFLLMWALGFKGIINVRQDIAIALCLFSIIYIKKKKLIPFFILFILAVSFHRSAIIWIGAYPIYHLKVSIKQWLIILFFTTFISLFFAKDILLLAGHMLGGEFELRLEKYLSEAYITSYGSAFSPIQKLIKSLSNAGLLAFIFFILARIFSTNLTFCGCLNLYMTSICLIIISTFSSPELTRIASYYNIIHIYLV